MTRKEYIELQIKAVEARAFALEGMIKSMGHHEVDAISAANAVSYSNYVELQYWKSQL